MVAVKLGLSDIHRRVEILVRQSRIHHFVTVLGQEGGLHATRFRDPSVEVKDFHIERSRPDSASNFIDGEREKYGLEATRKPQTKEPAINPGTAYDPAL